MILDLTPATSWLHHEYMSAFPPGTFTPLHRAHAHSTGPVQKAWQAGEFKRWTNRRIKAIGSMETNNAFYGLLRERFSGDRLYKIYLTNEAIVGIKVGGQFHDKLSVRAQLSPLYLTVIGIPLVEVLASRVEHRRLQVEMEVKKDLAMAAARDDSLVLPLADLSVVELSSRRSWWTMGINSGTVTFKCQNLDPLALVLTGNQDRERIGAMLRRLGITVELK